MLAGLPATTRTIDVNGVSTAVIEAGDGPGLLLLHGGIECGGAMWAPVLAKLAQHNRVVGARHPGPRRVSVRSPSRCRHVRRRWLTDVAELTGLERPTVVAHSLMRQSRRPVRHRAEI